MSDKNYVELIDENGETVLFNHIITMEYKEREYIALSAFNEETEEENAEEEVIILRIEKNQEDEDTYVTIDDDQELEDIFDAFLQVMDSVD